MELTGKGHGSRPYRLDARKLNTPFMQGGARLLGQDEAFALALCPDPHLLGVLFIEKVLG